MEASTGDYLYYGEYTIFTIQWDKSGKHLLSEGVNIEFIKQSQEQTGKNWIG